MTTVVLTNDPGAHAHECPPPLVSVQLLPSPHGLWAQVVASQHPSVPELHGVSVHVAVGSEALGEWPAVQLAAGKAPPPLPS